ncbi:MAG: tetratricopeptide repeat protein [Thermodesulfobacteriota bacterium]
MVRSAHSPYARAAACIIVLLFAAAPALAEKTYSEPRIKDAFAKGWALMGQMDKDIANLDRAADEYRAVLAVDPKNVDAYWKLSEVIFKKGEANKDPEVRKTLFTESQGYAEKALGLDSKSPEALYWLAVNQAMFADMDGGLKGLKLINRVKTELAQVSELDPKNRFSTLAKVVLANIYLEMPWPMTDLNKARALAYSAVMEDPNLTFATLVLGRVYAKQGKTEDARKMLTQCIETKTPTYPWDSVLYNWPQAKQTLAELK